jgi:hypothetical protein
MELRANPRGANGRTTLFEVQRNGNHGRNAYGINHKLGGVESFLQVRLAAKAESMGLSQRDM